MHGMDEQILAYLRRWLEDEHIDKQQGAVLDTSQFGCRLNGGPRQQNGFDCGMFVLRSAECRARNAKLTFSQADMAYFRRRTVLELLRGKLLPMLDRSPARHFPNFTNPIATTCNISVVLQTLHLLPEFQLPPGGQLARELQRSFSKSSCTTAGIRACEKA